MKKEIIDLLEKYNDLLNSGPERETAPGLAKQLRSLYTNVKSVALVRLDAIGDSFLFSNSISELKKLFPNAEITIFCYKETKEIIERQEAIDHHIFIDRKLLFKDVNYRENIFSIIQDLEFDLLLNPLFSRELYSEELVYFTNAKIKIGVLGDTSNIAKNLIKKTNVWYDFLLKTDPQKNKFELYRNAEIINLLGGNVKTFSLPLVKIKNEEKQVIENFLTENNLKNFAVVFPGSKGGKTSIKYWGPENFSKLVDYIKNEFNLEVILLGGPSEKDICQEIGALSKTNPVILQGQFSIWETMELLNHAEFYVGSDTSIAHFSAALKILTFVILGGGHFGRFFPYPGHDHVKAIYHKLDCYNCNWKCNMHTNICIKEISVEEVINFIKNNYSSTNQKEKLISFNNNKLKIDLLLPFSNKHSWHLGISWVLNFRKAGLLNKVFYLDENNYEYFFDYLKKGANSDLLLALGGDHHLYFLHDTNDKRELWRKYKNPKVCYSYESTIDTIYPVYKKRAKNAKKVFTNFLVADELDVNFYPKAKSIWFPQFADTSFFSNYINFSERENSIFFKGKLWDEYKLRKTIISTLYDNELISIESGFITNSELVQRYNKFKSIINPPGVFHGFNVRTFESLACGNLLFQFKPKNRPKNNSLFIDNTHLIYFDENDFGNLLEKILEFYENPEEYKQIAVEGYNEVKEHHSVNNRINTFLEWIQFNKKPVYPSYSPEQITNEIEDDKINLVSTEKKPLVSAIVSVYNSQEFIKGCLDDLVNQTLYDKGLLEIVIINSNSEQNEEKIINEYVKKYPNIVYVKTDVRETLYQSWNRAIKIARGKYITNANTDDRHRADALEVMANVLENNVKMDLVYADVYVSTKPNVHFKDYTEGIELKRPEFSPALLVRVCFIGPQPMWRKEIHNKIGYFDEIFKSAGDYEFWCRMVFENNSYFYHINEFLGVYYQNINGIELGNQKVSLEESLVVNNKYKKYLLNNSEIDFANELTLGLEYFEKKNYTLAIKHIKLVVENYKSKNLNEKYNISLDELLIILGNIYMLKKDLIKAKDYFEQALNQNPASSQACAGLGEIFFLSKMYNESKTMYEWAVVNDVNNAAAGEGLAKVNKKLGFPGNHNSIVEEQPVTKEEKTIAAKQ